VECSFLVGRLPWPCFAVGNGPGEKIEVNRTSNALPTKGVSQCEIEGDAPKAEYAVGYRRPPLHIRFKKDQSGNPNGRPAGRPNLKSVLERAMHQKVPVRQGKKVCKKPMFEAILSRRNPAVGLHQIPFRSTMTTARVFTNPRIALATNWVRFVDPGFEIAPFRSTAC
jgi:hypothetical protein